MKTRIALAGIALLLTAGMAGQVLAQNARGLFVGKKADGLEIRILKFQDGKLTLVDPSETFKSGDSIRIQFRTNFDGFVYFVNVSPSGVSKVIYKDKIKENALNELPGGADVITFDKEVGTEILKVVMSRDQIQVFEDAVLKADGTLGQSPGSAASELSSNKTEPKAVAAAKPSRQSHGDRGHRSSRQSIEHSLPRSRDGDGDTTLPRAPAGDRQSQERRRNSRRGNSREG